MLKLSWSWGRVAVAVGVGATALLQTAEARAEELSKALYDDAKSVIEELMVDEVARTTIPNAACQAPVLLRYYPNSMQRLFERQLGSLKLGLRTESATLLGSYVYSTLKKGAQDLPAFLRDQAPKLPQALGECPGKVTEANGPKYYAKTLPGGAPQPLLDSACSAGYPVTDTVPCEFSLATRDFLLDDKSGAEAHLRRALAFLLGKTFALTTHVQLEELTMVLAAYVKDPNLALPPAVTDKTLSDLLTAVPVDFLSAVKAVARQWRLLTSDGAERLSPEDVAESMLTLALPSLNAACKADAACARILTLATTVETREFIDALHRQDTREIAVEGLRAALSIVQSATECDNDQYGFFAESTNAPTSDKLYDAAKGSRPTCTQQVTVSRYGRFVATLASYVIEDKESGSTSDATRAAFRSAAFDLLRTDGPKTGFDRSFGYGIIVPQPALRISYSPGYINEATDNGVRYVATLDWLTFRKQIRYSQSVYTAASLSLVDLLAPFAEAALRKQAPSPNNSMRLWLGVVNPRAEFALGFPSLSKHLVLVGGLSYRATAAFRDPDSNDRYTYYTWLGSSERPSDFENKPGAFATQFIESSLGIRYIP